MTSPSSTVGLPFSASDSHFDGHAGLGRELRLGQTAGLARVADRASDVEWAQKQRLLGGIGGSCHADRISPFALFLVYVRTVK